MANETYDLTQTASQVQSIINDANKVKGAASQTSLTTEYVLLKDTSGEYHKIAKASFTEAVRNTLASLLVNNDKGTTISQVPVISSGDFGSATPANLASVLGVQVETIPANADLNNDTYRTSVGKVFICNAATIGKTISNTPYKGPFRLEVVPCAGPYFPMQRMYTASKDSQQIFVRYYENEWSNWYKASMTQAVMPE